MCIFVIPGRTHKRVLDALMSASPESSHTDFHVFLDSGPALTRARE
jgi:hypothetical protein